MAKKISTKTKSASTKESTKKKSSKKGTATTNAVATKTSKKKTTKKHPGRVMLITWDTIKFYVEPTRIQSFKGLSIATSTITEEVENGSKYVKKKLSGRYEIKLTAILDQRLGVDAVRKKALDMAEKARTGVTAYMYYMKSNKKLVTPQLMLTAATVQNIVTRPNGEWLSCEAQLTFTQCEKGDESTKKKSSGSGGSGGSGGGSGGGTGDDGTKGKSTVYTIQIPGMGKLRKTATSAQGAAGAACGKKYTGYVYVNGVLRHMTNGVLDPKIGEGTKEKDQNTNPLTGGKTETQTTPEKAQQKKEEAVKGIKEQEKNTTTPIEKPSTTVPKTVPANKKYQYTTTV